MSNIERIQAAAKRLQGHALKTPLLSSPFLDDIAGRRVYVKAECLQRTGSFKFRGAWSAVSALSNTDKSRGVIAFSSGNHAQGVALAARLHNIPAVIVMPSDAPKIKIENTRGLGAEVILYDRANERREDVVDKVNKTRNLTLIKPFDNPYVIAGQGTVGLEIAEQAAEAGIENAEVLVCCGGGGLTSGIALALETQAPRMTVHPCEPEGFDDVTRSLALGHIVANNQVIGSICDAITTPAPGELTFPIMKRLCGGGIAVTEDQCLQAMAVAFERLKIVIEPGGAVGLAAALYHQDTLHSDTVITVVSGGNVDASIFQNALKKYASSS